MTIPRMGLLFSQIKILDEKMLVTGFNQIQKASYTDANGNKQTGFYKPLNKKYTAFIGCGSVSASANMRLLAGEKISEDRLVFDDHEQVIGTFSLLLPGYRRMHDWSDTPPDDPEERRLVCPDVNDLLDSNIILVLLAKFLEEDDDVHNENISLAGGIDHDRTRLSFLSIACNKYRPGDGWIKPYAHTAMAMCNSILHNFPNFLGQTYSPANFPLDISITEFLTNKKAALNVNFKHVFWSVEAFQSLAKNPNNGRECAQDQLFAGCLKSLLVFNKDRVRLIQEAYLNNTPLDFHLFDSKIQESLCNRFPKIFSEDSQNHTYADMAMRFLVNKSKINYTTFTQYQGIEKNKFNVSVMGFCEFLQNMPSAFRKIRQELAEENKKMSAVWSCYIERVQQGLVDPKAPLATYCLPPEYYYDLDSIDRLYHKIWRDTHISLFRALLSDLIDMYNDFVNYDKKETKDSVDLLLFNDFDGCYQEDLNGLNFDCYSDIPRALFMLLSQLIHTVKTYAGKDVAQLTLSDNVEFNQTISKSLTESQEVIKEGLKHTQWLELFASITEEIAVFCEQFDLPRHLVKEDIPFNRRNQRTMPVFMQRDHTHPKVVKYGVVALFDWAQEIDRDMLLDIIKNTLQEYRKKSLNSNRSTSIGCYLKNTTESGIDILGYILSEGGIEKSSSFNSQLMTNMMQLACEKAGGLKEVSLFNIKQAFDNHCFDSKTYLIEAREYACTHPRFKHAHSKTTLREFNDAMYNLVNYYDQSQFKALLKDALKAYTPSMMNITANRNRMEYAQAIINNSLLTNADQLAQLFLEGGLKNTSLSVILFDRVINLLIAGVPKHRTGEFAKKAAELISIIQRYDNALNRKYYLKQLATHARMYCKPPSIQQELLFNNALFYFFDKIPVETAKIWLNQQIENQPDVKTAAMTMIIEQCWTNSEKLVKLLQELSFNEQKELFKNTVHYLKKCIDVNLGKPNIPEVAREKANIVNQYLEKHQDFYLNSMVANTPQMLQDKAENICFNFCKLFYGWINQQPSELFNRILRRALHNYSKGGLRYLSVFGQSKVRADEFKPLISDSSKTNQQKVTSILSKGSINECSLNNILLNEILSEIAKTQEKAVNFFKNRPDFSHLLVHLQQDANAKIKDELAQIELLSNSEPTVKLLDVCFTH